MIPAMLLMLACYLYCLWEYDRMNSDLPHRIFEIMHSAKAETTYDGAVEFSGRFFEEVKYALRFTDHMFE